MRSYFGQSKKGKKNNSSEKSIRQPQRGLGVAQLEKIRLQTEMMGRQRAQSSTYPDPSSPSTSSPAFGAHPILMMIGFGGFTEVTYGDQFFSGATRRFLNDTNSHITTTLFINEQDMEKSNIRSDHQQRQYSTGSVDQNSDSELDLDLKLSL